MEHIITNSNELYSAIERADSGDVFNIRGRIKLTTPLALAGKKELFFKGEDDAALDYMQPVSGFRKTELFGRTVFEADIPDSLAALKPYAAFAADGKMLKRPRLPKTGFYNVAGTPEFDMFSSSSGITMWTGNLQMTWNEGEIPVMKYPQTAQIRAFHWWTDELLYIKEIDYDSRVITFDAKSILTLMRENSTTDGARWYLDNVFEALSDPKEYYITPDYKKIYYVPENGENAENLTIQLSTSETLFEMDGCSGISFENIEFKGSDRDKLYFRPNFSQAAVGVPCAAALDGCSDITFRNCRFTDIGLSCIGIDKGSHNITVEKCDFTGIGGNPVHVKGRNVTKDEWVTTYPGGHFKNEVGDDVQHDIRVVGCHIGDYGRVYFNACGILLRYAYNCELSDNVIHDGYYTGISVGWVWGYAPSATNHVKIERNHIYNVGKRLLSDMGGIYTLGHQEGTVIRGNVIHDIEMDSYGGWGIYPDEGSSDILIEENICYRLSAQPFHQHYGANNLVRKNIFAFGEGGAFIVSRKEEHLSVILERNILISNGTPIYAKSPDGLNITDCMNLIWDYSRPDPLSGWMDYDVYTRTYSFSEANRRTVAQMKEGGLFNGVIIADPKFKDPMNGDFTLAEDSPAHQLGF